MKQKLIKNGFILAALMNFSVLVFSRGFTNVANLYIDSKASWSAVSPEGERYGTMPDVKEFIKMLGNELHG